MSTLSLHDALPICRGADGERPPGEVRKIVGEIITGETHVGAAAVEKFRPRIVLAEIIERAGDVVSRSEEHTSELQSHVNLVCRLLLEKKKRTTSQKRRGPPAADRCLRSFIRRPTP